MKTGLGECNRAHQTVNIMREKNYQLNDSIGETRKVKLAVNKFRLKREWSWPFKGVSF